MSRRVLISGYYGCGNAGDEAVLQAMLKALALARPDFEPVVLSASPPQTHRRHGVASVPRMSPSALLTSIARCDLLLSGGGSLLQDVTSLRSCLYYLLVMRLGQLARKPVMVYAQGLGPLRRPRTRRLVRETLRRCRAVSVRDAESADLLAELGLAGDRVEVTADPVFGLYDASVTAAAGDRAALALRPWLGDAGVLPRAARLASLAAGERGVLLVPMQEPDDRALAEGIAAAARVPTETLPANLSADELLGRLRSVRVLAGMRLHALILAAIARVPVAALSYDPKVRGLMRLLGAEDRCLVYSAEPEEVWSQMEQAAREGPRVGPSELEDLRRRALRSAEIAASLVP